MLGLNPKQDEDFQQQVLIENRTFDPSVTEPSFFEGSGEALLKGAAQGTIGQGGQLIADAIDPTLAAYGKRIDDIFGTDIEGFWKRDQQNARDMVKRLTPDPKTTGTGAQILYSLSSVLPQAIIGGAVGGPAGAAALPGVLQGYSENVKLQQEGVDPVTAMEVGGITGLSTAAGVLMPASIGTGLLQKLVSGAALNTAVGIPTRYGSSEVLKAGGYEEMAKQFEPMDTTALISDIVLGAGFGAIAHAFPHEATDAAIVARNNYHAEVNTAPGIAVDTASRTAHNAAIEAKMQELLTGERQDVSQFIKPETTFLPDPEKAAAYDAMKGIIDESGLGDILRQNDEMAAKLQELGITPDDAVKYSKGGFRSTVEDAATALKQDKASGEQFLNMLKNTAGVKSEELDWMGLPEFLAGKKSVTKQEVLDFIAQNKVQLEEVTLQKDGASIQEYRVIRPDGISDGRYGTLSQAQARAGDIGGFVEEAGTISLDNTKYSDRTLPGGENYREVLLTLPKEGDAYKSSHFDQPNIIAHVRLNDRVDADGKKVLFVEEIQSDWHQAGRKRGYKIPADKVAERQRIVDKIRKEGSASLTAEENQFYDDYQAGKFGSLKGDNAVPDAPFKKTWHELAFKRILQEAVAKGYDRVAWTTGEQQSARYDLSKQIDAVYYEKNDDGTYNLIAHKHGDVKDNATKVFDEEHLTVEQLEEYVGKEVAKKIVDNSGTKLPRDAPRYGSAYRDWHALSGLDLKVGGEGMKGFYDKIIPDYAKKLGKKYGAKVGEAKVNAPEDGISELYDVVLPNGKVVKQTESLKQAEASAKSFEGATVRKVDMGETVHSMDITPELRAAVEGGLPMFARGRGDAIGANVSDVNNAVRESFGEATDALMKAGKIKVVQSVKDLPGEHPADVRGMTDAKGNVYIVADNVSLKDVRGLVLHEVGVHAGMEKMLGKRLMDKVLVDLQALEASGNARVMEARRLIPEDTKPEHVNEELLAYLVQNAPELPLVQRIISAIKNFIYKITDGKLVNLSDRDMTQMAVAALKQQAFKVAKEAKPQKSIEDQVLADNPDIAVVDDNGQPMRAEMALEQADEAVKESNKKKPLFEIAANCALR